MTLGVGMGCRATPGRADGGGGGRMGAARDVRPAGGGGSFRRGRTACGGTGNAEPAGSGSEAMARDVVTSDEGGRTMEFEGIDGLPGVIRIDPDMSADDRGVFVELYNQRKYEEGGVAWRFAQADLWTLARGTLHGLHFQHPRAQGRLVSVTRGEVFEVAVDIRVGSPTFGVARGVRLSAENRRQLYLPPDHAHGFLVLSDEADVVCQCTDLDHPEDGHVLLWNDPALAIEWPFDGPRLSEQDRAGLTLADYSEAGMLPLYIA